MIRYYLKEGFQDTPKTQAEMEKKIESINAEIRTIHASSAKNCLRIQRLVGMVDGLLWVLRRHI